MGESQDIKVVGSGTHRILFFKDRLHGADPVPDGRGFLEPHFPGGRPHFPAKITDHPPPSTLQKADEFIDNPVVGLPVGLPGTGSRAPPHLEVHAGTTRPSPSPRPMVTEAHIFDWAGGLGGRRIKVYLIKRLREDITFKNEKELVSRMEEDERQARSLLS